MPVEMISGLWYGYELDSKNITFLINKNIDCIINCTKNIGFIKKYECEKIRIPIEDDNTYKSLKNNAIILDYLDDTVNFINNKLNNGENILIFCKSGTQCSPAIISAYIIKYCQVSVEMALKYVRSKNDNAFKKCVFFCNALEKFRLKINK